MDPYYFLDDLELNYDEMENMDDFEELIISADELIFDKENYGLFISRDLGR